jgi:two-component system chemotaxis sensor kinase CheA
LEIQPAGKHISEVLHLNEKQAETMNTALKLVFNQTHAMSFDELMRFAPKTYNHSSGAIVRLVYKPDRLPTGALDRVVVIASDVTEQVHENERAAERKALFESLERIFHDKPFFGSYDSRLNEMLAILRGQGPEMSWETLRREIHTLKGDAGIFKLGKLASSLHDLENEIAPCVHASPTQSLSANDPCLAVTAKVREEIADEVSALSNYLNNFLGMDITRIEAERSFDANHLYAFADTLVQKGQKDLYKDYIRTVCAESLRAYLGRFDTVLSDLAFRFNKKIKPICFVNDDIPIVVDLDRGLLDSFVHLFRNIADHGVEKPEAREKEGKDPAAEVQIRTSLIEYPAGNCTLHIEIEDDGAGIDIQKLRAKLSTKEPDKAWQDCSDKKILDALLTQNISSLDTANLYSGRGLGVGAVYAKVRALGGSMSIDSSWRKSTCVAIDVPYLLETPTRLEVRVV